MRIHLLTTHLPPELDGTADHTWGTALGLMRHSQVTILHPHAGSHWPLEGVRFVPAFDRDRHSSLREVSRVVIEEAPDWLLVQFYPMSYGGSEMGELNLVRMLRDIRRANPRTHIGLIIHERVPQVLRSSNPLRRLWIRRRMEWAIGCSDVTFLLVEAWRRDFESRMKHATFRTLHLGSMFPPSDRSGADMRAQLGIPPETLVLGLFGRGEPTRTLDLLRPALDRLTASGRKFTLLHMGRDEGRTALCLSQYPVQSSGPVTHQDVTRHAAAMDIYLGPYEDGCSTRRTSMMMALACGLPVVGTKGEATPKVILEADGKALLLAAIDRPDHLADHVMRLADDRALRRAFGDAGRGLYEREFTYDAAAGKLIGYLREFKTV